MVSLAVAFTTETNERPMAGRGRPGPAATPRLVRLGAVMLLAGGIHTGERIARDHGVARMTLYRWRREFLADPRPDCDVIRRMVDVHRPALRLASA